MYLVRNMKGPKEITRIRVQVVFSLEGGVILQDQEKNSQIRINYLQEPPSLITSSVPLVALFGPFSSPASFLSVPKSPYKSLSLAKLLDADVFSLLSFLEGLG